MSLYYKGLKRKGRKLKQDIGINISKGKKPMSKQVCSFLAKTLFASRETEHMFSHLFLLLDS